MQIEQLTLEEYTSLLAYGDPVASAAIESFSTYYDNDSQTELTWISTLGSTTYPVMTFGYIDVL